MSIKWFVYGLAGGGGKMCGGLARSVSFCTLLMVALLLAGCMGGDSGTKGQPGTPGSGPTTTAEPVGLSKLRWCNTNPSQVFMDNSSTTIPTPVTGKTVEPVNLGPANGTPVAINDWNTLKANLGFTVYLPETLPAGSCLLSASGTVRDEGLGSNFVLTYMLPDQQALTISQAPQYTQNKDLQCSISDTTGQVQPAEGTPAATPTVPLLPLQVCSAIRDTTTITFSARWKMEELKPFYESLKPDVNWSPAA